jgi:type VI secretion system lysozyme-like protein
MARYLEDDELTLTVLDRLLEQPPKAGDIGVRSRSPFLDSIARDLEVLLNTRREEPMVPPEYEEAATSILNFGVPELTWYGNLSHPIEQNKLCKAMEESIRLFEPRLRKISVRAIGLDNPKASVRFRLEATIEFLSEREVFEIGLKRDTGRMSVSPGGNR